MFDICDIFKRLQKGLQTDLLILPDVLTLRDSASRKLDVILSNPMPGGKEQELVTTHDEEEGIDIGSRSQSRTAAKQHQFVTSNSRCFSAVRIEVVMSAKNFLSQRLNIETDGTLQQMTTVTNANTCNDFVSACVAAVKLFTSSNKQQQLVHECCDAWEDISGIPVFDTVDAGTKTSLRLRHLYAYSTGVLKFLLGSFLVVSPHSMGTERVVSHHNKLKSIQRASLSNEQSK